VSHAANRLLLAAAAADGDHILPYDLDNAFLNARLDRDIFCRLPPVWAEKHGYDKVKLYKALYGLKDAPKAWYDTYTKILKNLGWEPSPDAPGLWRKPSVVIPGKYLKKSVYVDNNLATGPDLNELQGELNKIFGFCSGRFIDITTRRDPDGTLWQDLDFLGSDVEYNRQKRTFRLHMKTYIEKTAKKFNITCGKPEHSPNFDESAFLNENSKEGTSYNLREVVGALLWICATARPDISVPTSTLARYCTHNATKAIIKAATKVIKYLLTTKTEGVGYSPEEEEAFDRTYCPLLPEGRGMPKINLFSDAGFANCLKTMRSTSGSIMYYRGCAIIWRSNRQGVRAYSTAESEYIAASDTIVLSEHNNFLDFFEPPPDKMEEVNHGAAPSGSDFILWVDNQSAITTAKSEGTKPKSRHYALRYLRVKDEASKIVFCPTTLMKADPLTKLECSVPQRRLILRHVENPVIWDTPADGDHDHSDEVDVRNCYCAYLAYCA